MTRPVKKRSILFIVVVGSIAFHVLGLGILGVIKIVEEVSAPPPEFEAVVADTEPPPPPPPPPTTRSTRQSMPRPEPLAAQNPLDMAVPQIEISSAEMVMGISGRGGSGGFGTGGAARASIGLFGDFNPFEGALAGTFYDTKQDADGESIPSENAAYHELVKRFAGGSWNTSVLDGFFSPDAKLYTRQIFLPFMNANSGPSHFGVGDVVDPKRWLIHYKGTFQPNRTTRFRFVGRAGEVLIVRFDGRVVFDGSHTYLNENPSGNEIKVTNWTSRANAGKYKTFSSGKWTETETLVFSGWIDVRAGQSYDLEILLGERGGGDFYSFLLYEEAHDPGEELPNGLYRLPIFTTDLGPAQPVAFDEGSKGPAVRQ